MHQQLRFIAWTAALAVLIAGLAAIPTAGASSASSPDASVEASASAKCTARILRGRAYVNLTYKTWVYKFRRVKGSKPKRFKRVVVRVKRLVKTSCARRCVLTKKKKGKRRAVFVLKRQRVKVKRGNRIKTIRRKVRVYKFGTCPTTASSLGQPVTVEVLPESRAFLDFGSFQREAPVSGKLKGFVPGGVRLDRDNQVTFTSGSLTLGQTPVFIDDDCNGQVTSSIRTGTPTQVLLDATKTSTSTLKSTGEVTSINYMKIRLPLELRNDDTGCDQPYITTGYTEFKKTFFLKGVLGGGGLQKVVLTSPPDTLDVEACLSPGPPNQPCNGFVIPLPILMSTRLVVAIDISGRG